MASPKPFLHTHPPAPNVKVLLEQELSVGQRAANRVAAVVGSSPFVLTQTLLLALWITLNFTA